MLFIFCAKAALLAKRAAACDKVEKGDDFDGWMSQRHCEWISDRVDERKLSDKSPIPCPDHQEFANIAAAVDAQIPSQNQPPKPAPKPPAKGDSHGKKKKHVQQFTMRYRLTKKGFISEPVDL